MHWRRFKIADLPLDDHDKMYDWLIQRWREKDQLLETFSKTGKFPADKVAVEIEGGPKDAFKTPYINTEVRPRTPWEVFQIFMPVAAATMVGRVGVQILDRLFPAGGR